jgi:hypothetical protein
MADITKYPHEMDMIEHPKAGGPQFSADGKWWWDGHDWLPAANAPASEPVLVTIGDIACTRTKVITPGGTRPLAGTTWSVSNNTMTTSSVSTLGVVLCIVFFLFCLLGLLFLLMKDTRTTGYVQVSVQGDGLYHAVQIPVSAPFAVGQIEQQVNYARSLAAALPTTRS